ncbi:hypothetical protein B0181_04185 [Moraxella caviae]|uniref:Uncharacterized protein n=1 Tax=Moraxella caviae TaxID=34060 RepID=A0A1T0A4Z4_9GAMM|nr:hypothetical protein [Moraxella caviae]OOR90806.1 hypothetical protein B0181_04185 [Moraxella caviae]STZ10633.1 Uncharacterised protein [Moraxella caviae]
MPIKQPANKTIKLNDEHGNWISLLGMMVVVQILIVMNKFTGFDVAVWVYAVLALAPVLFFWRMVQIFYHQKVWASITKTRKVLHWLGAQIAIVVSYGCFVQLGMMRSGLVFGLFCALCIGQFALIMLVANRCARVYKQKMGE